MIDFSPSAVRSVAVSVTMLAYTPNLTEEGYQDYVQTVTRFGGNPSNQDVWRHWQKRKM